jgi:hypothetical protein
MSGDRPLCSDRLVKKMSEQPRYKIIRSHASLVDLENLVNAAADYTPTGAPFRDNDSREWCQAMTLRTAPVEIGNVNLREPAKKR